MSGEKNLSQRLALYVKGLRSTIGNDRAMAEQHAGRHEYDQATACINRARVKEEITKSLGCILGTKSDGLDHVREKLSELSRTAETERKEANSMKDRDLLFYWNGVTFATGEIASCMKDENNE